MLVQVHTDPNIESSQTLTSRAESYVTGAIGRYADRVSRVQVHLGDENSHKNGSADKRCMMEARLDGRPPIAVTHFAATLEQCILGRIRTWRFPKPRAGGAVVVTLPLVFAPDTPASTPTQQR